MKNIFIYSLAALTFLFVGCEESLDDIYNDLDIDPDSELISVVKDFEYTLTEDDYDIVDQSFPNFSGEDEAKEKVPTIMAELFSYLADGSSALVTYNVYNGSSPYFATGTEVTVTDADYDALGYSYGNFDDLDGDLPIYAAYKMPDASTGAYLDVTHDYYNGSYVEYDVESRVVKTSPYGWMYVWPLPSSTYREFFGESFSNFSDTDEAEAKIPVYLSEEFKFAEEGTSILVGYVYYDGGVQDDLAHFTLVDGEWVLYGDGFQVTPQSLSFGLSDGEWVPDNTIKLTLAFDDWVWISENWADKNAAGSESVASYRNFDVTLWTEQQRFEAITGRLMVAYPNTEEGQKYLVTYATWEPGAGSRSLYVIYEGGEFVTFEQ
ncbi:MAG: hypothetical protein CMP48_19805 [Rickettsiales bacterium]|nr:hypothetical protein [Rickettsiales bacterium]